MHKILVAGAGRVGSLIATLLARTKDYEVFLVDKNLQGAEIHRLEEPLAHIHPNELDIADTKKLLAYVQTNKIEVVVSCLPFYCNVALAEVARSQSLHYFDLTEDNKVTEEIKALANGATQAFVPQCGLAPGVVGIIANDLMGAYDEIDKVKMRVGALPLHVSNALKYVLTWSTDGLINQYGNPCEAIVAGKIMQIKPLGDLERIELDGNSYEAFNTSGGLGSLAKLYEGKVHSLNYKTMRYKGHCEKMRFLMHELRLNKQRDVLKKIFEKAVPKASEDVVIIYVSVTGKRDGELCESHYMNKLYPQKVAGTEWSAIQIATASSLCVVLDLVMNAPETYQGFIYQEKIPFATFLENRFGEFYGPKEAAKE